MIILPIDLVSFIVNSLPPCCGSPMGAVFVLRTQVSDSSVIHLALKFRMSGLSDLTLYQVFDSCQVTGTAMDYACTK